MNFESSNLDVKPSTSPQKQVDLSRIFSDVSRTVSGIRTILGGPLKSTKQQLGENSQSLVASDTGIEENSQMNNEASPSGINGVGETETSPFGGLFGGSNVCFKTCGMEDIQFAARRAGEMFLTMKVCMIVLTVITVICAVALTLAVLIHFYQKRRLTQSIDYSSANFSTDTSSTTNTLQPNCQRMKDALAKALHNNETTYTCNNSNNSSPPHQVVMNGKKYNT